MVGGAMMKSGTGRYDKISEVKLATTKGVRGLACCSTRSAASTGGSCDVVIVDERFGLLELDEGGSDGVACQMAHDGGSQLSRRRVRK